MKTLIALLVLTVATESHATEIMTDIGDSYQDATGNWYLAIFPYAQSLFFLLASIQLVWSTIRWVLVGEGAERVITNLLFLMMSLGFFYAILMNFNTWIPAIINSFVQIGAEASGLTVLDPSTIADLGVSMAGTILRALGGGGLIDSVIGAIIGGFAALVIVICFAIIAGQLLVTLIESFIVIGAGVLMVGFAGSKWTVGITERSLGYAVAVGVKLFMLYLIIGLGVAVAVQWLPLLESASLDSPDPLYAVIGSSIVFLMLSWNIPSMAASLVSGGVSMTLGGAMSTALLTGAGVAGAGAGGGAMLGRSMQTLTRSMQNLTAAVKHGSAVGSGEHSLARGLGAGAGSLAGEAGRGALRQLSGGHNRTAANITRRTSAYREKTAAKGLSSPSRHRSSPHRAGLKQAAHNIPKDEANVQTNDVHLKVDDDDR